MENAPRTLVLTEEERFALSNVQDDSPEDRLCNFIYKLVTPDEVFDSLGTVTGPWEAPGDMSVTFTPAKINRLRKLRAACGNRPLQTALDKISAVIA